MTGPDRSAQERIDERRHQIDGIGIAARYELFKAGTGNERGPCLLALVPQTDQEPASGRRAICRCSAVAFIAARSSGASI